MVQPTGDTRVEHLPAALLADRKLLHRRPPTVLPSFLPGDRISAAEAERIGLISRAVPAAQLMAEARKVRPPCLHTTKPQAYA